MNGLDLDPQLHLATHVGLFIIWRLATILNRINMALVPRLIANPRKAPRLLGSSFAVQSLMQDLANIGKDVTLGVVTIMNKPNQQDLYQKYLN
jgi:hypothetical protein